MNMVDRFEEIFLPLMNGIYSRLILPPRVSAKVWSSSVGGNTSFQGHNLGIECIKRDVANNEADNIALSVGIKNITTRPCFYEADVCWGHLGNGIVVDLIRYDMEFNDKNITIVRDGLPILSDALERSLVEWK